MSKEDEGQELQGGLNCQVPLFGSSCLERGASSPCLNCRAFRTIQRGNNPHNLASDVAPKTEPIGNQEWVELCELAMKECPTEFASVLTELAFAGNQLITEARLNAEINAAKEAIYETL